MGIWNRETEEKIKALWAVEAIRNDGLVDLAKGPDIAQGQARVESRWPLVLLCDIQGCDGEADAIHFRPWIVGLNGREGPEEIMAACAAHDPGGYHVYIKDLNNAPFQKLGHLANKNTDAVLQLLRWLYPAW